MALLPREDSWVNPTTGYGPGYDKTNDAIFLSTTRLNDRLLSALYYGDPIAHRLVNIIPQEMFRRGYCLSSDSDPELAQERYKQGKAIDIDGRLRKTLKWGRLWGGCLGILGANDGAGDLSKPLRPEAVRAFSFINLIDRRYAQVARFYTDANSPKYNQPEIYMITTLRGQVFYVHESRVVRFDGTEVDDEKAYALAGWSDSVLQLQYDILKKLAAGYDSSSSLLADANQAVFKLKGLMKQVATGGKEALQTRMRAVDLTRSSGRSVLLDTEEDFKREVTSFTGIPDVLDRFMMLLSAGTGIPVTLLMGRSPAGMNATGDADFRAFYDVIASEQEKIVTPVLLKLYALFGQLPEDIEVEWHPLYEPSDKEQAETEEIEERTEKTRAEKYAVYLGASVLLPEQVALHEFGTDEEIVIEEAALRASLKTEIDLALDPAVTGPGSGGATGSSSQQIYGYHLQYGVLTLNEMRARLGLPPIAGGDEPPVPVTDPNAATPADPAADPNAVTAPPAKTNVQAP